MTQEEKIRYSEGIDPDALYDFIVENNLNVYTRDPNAMIRLYDVEMNAAEYHNVRWEVGTRRVLEEMQQEVNWEFYTQYQKSPPF